VSNEETRAIALAWSRRHRNRESHFIREDCLFGRKASTAQKKPTSDSFAIWSSVPIFSECPNSSSACRRPARSSPPEQTGSTRSRMTAISSLAGTGRDASVADGKLAAYRCVHFGGCNPGELAHSSIWEAVSARRARLIKSACSGPGRS
jgi:hypothetical protein